MLMMEISGIDQSYQLQQVLLTMYCGHLLQTKKDIPVYM